MNAYLLMLGGQVSEIRKILNLTQDDLAKMMGVSRPTIVKIEQDPSKLSKALAYALFGSVAVEFQKRIRKLDVISPDGYQKVDQLGGLMTDLQEATSISTTNLSKTVTLKMGQFIPGIGTLISTGLKVGFRGLKGASIGLLKESIKWDEEKAKRIIEIVRNHMQDNYDELLKCFNIEALEIEYFGIALEQGEKEEFEVW